MGKLLTKCLCPPRLSVSQAVIAAWITFIAFSLGCGLAQSIKQLIVMRTLQGVGGSGLYSMTNLSK